ncbi:GAF domain-containing protein [Pseudarthrobacter sp. YS3]|uniref:GAF domain-containing protein n=1 Tax=Pseudarthrobacter sp. YS3 TaxID=3453718 RepID=UPI003EEC8226
MAASLLGGETPLACAISVLRGKDPEVLASSSDRARRLDRVQHEAGEGPCLLALGGLSHVFIPALDSNGGWFRLAGTARREGIRSVLATPIHAGDSVRAALSCYSAFQNTFEQSVIDAVEELAGSMSRTVQVALGSHSRDLESEQWRASLRSRAVVDGAVALIIVQDRCSRVEALTALHQGARTSGRPLLEEAGNVLIGKFPRTT